MNGFKTLKVLEYVDDQREHGPYIVNADELRKAAKTLIAWLDEPHEKTRERFLREDEALLLEIFGEYPTTKMLIGAMKGLEYFLDLMKK